MEEKKEEQKSFTPFLEYLKKESQQKIEEKKHDDERKTQRVLETIGIGDRLPQSVRQHDLAKNTIREISEQAFSSNLSPYENDDFTVDTIADLIAENSSEGELIDNGNELKPLLHELISSGFTAALSSENPGINLRRATLTIGKALTEIDDVVDSTEQITQILEDISKSLVSPEIAQQMMFHPIDMSSITNILFENELDLLKKQKLTVSEIQTIRRQFDSHLAAVARIAQEQKTGTDIQTFISLQEWINENIVNENLKQTLDNDLQIFIHDLQGALVQSEAPRVTPLSMFRNVHISKNINKKITDSFLKKRLNQITELEDTNEGDADILLMQTIKEFQNLVMANNLKVYGHDLDIQTTNNDGSEKGRDVLHKELTEIMKLLKIGGVNYTYTPVIVDDQASGENVQQILLDLSRLLSETSKIDIAMNENKRLGIRMKKQTRHKRERFTNLVKETLLGNITVSQTTNKNNMRVIVFPPSATIADLMRIAHILTLENGFLSDVDRNNLLQIIKDKTTISDIIKVIMSEQKKNVGRTVRIYFTPEHKLGGAFMDTSLNLMFSKPLLSPHMNTKSNYMGGIERKTGDIPNSGFINTDPRFEILNIPISMLTNFPVQAY